MAKHAQQIRLIKFAKEHDYIITPVGWKSHLKQIDKLNHCPCMPDRPECPCPESVQEIHDKGHCVCSLFYRSYDTYLTICYPDEWPPEIEAYNLNRHCVECGQEDLIKPIKILPSGRGLYSSNKDHCTKCGAIWGDSVND